MVDSWETLNIYSQIWKNLRNQIKRKFYLGGLIIKSNLGTLGHSDGDPVLHSITDAILGACKMGDIGNKFSDKSKKFKNIRSTILLKKIIEQIKSKVYFLVQVGLILDSKVVHLKRMQL